MDIFTYGSLMVPAIMAAVTGRRMPSKPATLHGYARFCITGEVYPGIIEMNGALTDGILYFGVEKDTLEILDAFEGDYYQRTPVAVTTDVGSGRESVTGAQTYVIRPEYRHLLSDRPWDFDTFRDRFQDAFMRQYAGFSIIQEDKPGF